MTDQDKELLLKELCARLLYGVKVYTDAYRKPFTLGGYYNYRADEFYFTEPEFWLEIQFFKPYLRPMSNMTEEERNELSHYDNSVQRTDFFYSHHIDCRYMIEKGLALEAPKGMYE